MHFIKRRQDPTDNLTSTIQFGIRNMEVKKISLRVLGVWVDLKLIQKEHIKKTLKKTAIIYNLFIKIIASIQSSSVRRSKLLYSTIVRPIIKYRSQIWGFKEKGSELSKEVLKPLKLAQNRCLQYIIEAYKYTPIVALKREAGIPPLKLYIKITAL